MLAARTWDIIHRWVGWRLGCPLDAIGADGILTQAHSGAFADYHGVYVWLMGQAAIISAPADLTDAVARLVVGQPLATLVDPAFWRAALGERVERIVGPSYQGFVDAITYRPGPTRGARRLLAGDLPALSRFISACPPDDWRDSAISPDHQPIVALMRDGAIIALASAPADGPADIGMRSVGVVTLPTWRGQGAGRAVVGALTWYWLMNWLEPDSTLHYQTLRANGASVAIAQALGYVDVATALAVRLC